MPPPPTSETMRYRAPRIVPGVSWRAARGASEGGQKAVDSSAIDGHLRQPALAAGRDDECVSCDCHHEQKREERAPEVPRAGIERDRHAPDEEIRKDAGTVCKQTEAKDQNEHRDADHEPEEHADPQRARHIA